MTGEPDNAERPAGRWRELLQRRVSPGGLSIGGFLVVEAVCWGALAAAILVAML